MEPGRGPTTTKQSRRNPQQRRSAQANALDAALALAAAAAVDPERNEEKEPDAGAGEDHVEQHKVVEVALPDVAVLVVAAVALAAPRRAESRVCAVDADLAVGALQTGGEGWGVGGEEVTAATRQW